MSETLETEGEGVRAGTWLEVRNVSLRVRDRTLLDGLGFETLAGEVVAIIGPNGAGKTTLLEALVGLRRVDFGSVALGGCDLRTFADRARTFAYLPDNAELPSELDVRTVVEHTLRFHARPAPLVQELREALGVSPLLDMPCGALSRGERQRIALFCALAIERAVVVLDEPFSAFDPLQLRDVLRAVRRVTDAGAAIVASVHQLDDAEKIADRVLLLAAGRRVAWGTLAGLREQVGLPHAKLEDVFIALLEGRRGAA